MKPGPAGALRKSLVAESSEGRPPTPGQVAFDIAFGIVLPVVCLVVDPGAFRGRKPLLGGYAAAAYAFIFQAMIFLGVWLSWRRGALVLTGPLLAAGCFALGLGLLLLPFGFVLIAYGIGILGFVPIGTAVVFLKNGARAMRTARLGHAPALVLVAMAISGIATVAFPLAAQHLLNRRTQALVEAVLSGDARQEVQAVSDLKPLGWLADREYVFEAWRRLNYDEAERLDRVWREATGRELVLVGD